jgi:hypothetical protein
MSINNPPNPEDDTPDWLKNLQSGIGNESKQLHSPGETSTPFQTEDSQVEFPASPEIKSNEETPEWLQNIREKEGTADLPQIKDEANVEDSSWLERVRSQEEEFEEPAENSIESEDNFLDRIQSIKEAESTQSEDDDANWVEGLPYKETETPTFNITKPQITEDETSLLGVDPRDEKTIDKANDQWLSNLTSAQEKPPGKIELHNEEELLEPVRPFIEDLNSEVIASLETDSLPGWLVDLQENSPLVDVPISKQLEDDESHPILETNKSIDEDATLLLKTTDIPEWLSEISPSDDHNIEDLSPLPFAPKPPAFIDIPKTIEEEKKDELPSWLQALKPDDIIDIDDEFVDEIISKGQPETYGPLSGLRNLLPAEPDAVQFGSPQIPIINLVISDSQLENAKTLHYLATTEDQSVVMEKRKRTVQNPLIRILIAIVLYVSVFIPTLIDSKSLSFPDPRFPPSEIADAAQEIHDLPENSVVLIAFDYQPGFAGEIEAAASSLIDYMGLKGATIITITTQPTGQGLATRMFGQIDVPFINLGYVSGEMAALNNFTHYPQDTIRPIITTQNLLYLSNIESINNFDLVMVLTDNADLGRAWVEQVQPELALNDTPLIMAMSAQAEPLLSPYYRNEPKQIAGFSSGLIGGAYFEQYIGNENIARVYWDSYGAVLSISILILTASAIYNISMNLINRTKKDEE